MGFRDGLMQCLKAETVDLCKLVYQDECPVYYGIAARTARAEMGTEVHMEECHSKGKGKLNVFATIGIDGIYKVCINLDKGTNTEHFCAYATEAQDGKYTIGGRSPKTIDAPHLGGASLLDLIPKKDGYILLLDRLGRSGAAADPTAGHYHPGVRAKFLAVGIGYDLLPPKGAEFNPIELFNGLLQRMVLRWEPPGAKKDTFGQKVRGPRTLEEAIIAVNDVVGELMRDRGLPALFRSFYHRRATGSEALNRWLKSEDARELMARRAANPEAMTYNLAEGAFRDDRLQVNNQTFHKAPKPRAGAAERGAADAAQRSRDAAAWERVTRAMDEFGEIVQDQDLPGVPMEGAPSSGARMRSRGRGRNRGSKAARTASASAPARGGVSDDEGDVAGALLALGEVTGHEAGEERSHEAGEEESDSEQPIALVRWSSQFLRACPRF